MGVLSNTKWNAFSQIFKVIVQLVNIVYLAKIIPPQDYGLLAMAFVVTNFGILIRDLGMNSALIQTRELTENLKNTVFWINIFFGILISIVIIISSGIISEFYEQPKLESVLLLLSVIFPLSSMSSSHLALLERNSQFKRISFIEVSSSFISVVIAITMAKLGYGVYSLVFQSISITLFSTILFWHFSPWRPSLKPIIKREEISKILSFSGNLSIFNFVNYFSRNSDSFIIGKFMSAFILGNYSLAYRIMLFPLQSLTFVVTRSLYPVLSQHQDDNNIIRKTYFDVVFVILAITAPLMSGVAIYSHPFINLVFGKEWQLAASILSWLAPVAIIQSVLSTTGSVFSAKGRTYLMMKLGLLGAFLQVGSFIIGSFYSIQVFACLYLISNIFNFVPTMYFTLKVIGGGGRVLFNKLIPIVISVLIMICVLLCLNHYFLINDGYGFIFISLPGIVIYIFAMLLLSKEFKSFFIGLLTNKIKR